MNNLILVLGIFLLFMNKHQIYIINYVFLNLGCMGENILQILHKEILLVFMYHDIPLSKTVL